MGSSLKITSFYSFIWTPHIGPLLFGISLWFSMFKEHPYIDLLSFLVGDDLRDNRLLFLDKETIQETEMKRKRYV